VSLDVTFIYVLKDPVTGEVRYVGKTDRPDKRLVQHIGIAQRKRHHAACWVRSLLKRGLQPKLEVVDEVPVEYWQALEAAYIAFYKELGFRLVNRTPGGDGFGAGEEHPSFGHKWTDEQRERHKAALTLEVRAKMAASMKGRKPPNLAQLQELSRTRPRSQAEREAISRAQKGKPKSPETRAKIRVTLTGRKASAETRAKLSAVRMGHGCSSETRAKLSAAYTEERKAQLRARLTGVPRSVEVRQKIIRTKARGQLFLPL